MILEHKVSNAKVNNTCLNPYLARFAKSVASGSNNAITIYTKGNAKSEASGSNQTGAIKSKESGELFRKKKTVHLYFA